MEMPEIPNVIYLISLSAIFYHHFYICLETISSTIDSLWESTHARSDIEMKLSKYISEEKKFKSDWIFTFLSNMLSIICTPEERGTEAFEAFCHEQEVTFDEASQIIKNNEEINGFYQNALQESQSNQWVLEKLQLETELKNSEHPHQLLINCLSQYATELIILIGLITLEAYSLIGINDIMKSIVISGLTLVSTYFMFILWLYLPLVLNFLSDKIFSITAKEQDQKEYFHSVCFCVLTHSVIWIYIFYRFKFKTKDESSQVKILDKQDAPKNNTKQIKQEFKCIICLNVMKAPLQIFGCSNDHLMCSKCVTTMKRCPKCKEDFNKTKPKRRLTSERLLAALLSE